MGAGGSDGAAGGLSLVAAEVVEDDDVAFGEGRPENLLDVEGEELAVDRAVDDPGCVDAIASQGGDEGERLPMAVRHAGLEPLSTRPPAAQGRHVGLDPGLVDEDEPSRLNPTLTGLPARPLAGDVGENSQLIPAHGREHGVGCIASSPGQVVAPHPVLVLEVTDRGLHGRAPAERAFDGSSKPSLLTCHVDLEALVLRCVVALVPGVGDDPLEASADGALDVGEDGCERVPVIGIAGERLHVGDKLAAPAAVEGRRHADLDAELIGFVGLSFANALDLGSMQRVELPATLALILEPASPRERQRESPQARTTRSSEPQRKAAGCLTAPRKRHGSGRTTGVPTTREAGRVKAGQFAGNRTSTG